MNKYKKLAVNTVVFAIGSFGSKIISLLMNNLYTKHISPADFYTKNLLEMTALFLMPVFTFSMTEAIIRYGLDRKYNKKEVFSTASVMTGIGLGAMLLIMPFLHFIPFLRQIKEFSVLLTIYMLTSSLRGLCSQFVRAKGMVRLFSLDGILTTFMLLIFNLIFISKLRLGVGGFMISVILSDLCSSVFLFFSAKLYEYFDFKCYRSKLGTSMLEFTMPLIPTIVMWTITELSDQIFVGNMHSDSVYLGESAAGLYASATKVPNLLAMVSTIFFQAWNMSAITENESADRSEFYERVYEAYEAILFVGSAILILALKPVTALLINYNTFPEYREAYIYTPLLIAAAVFNCLNLFLFGIYTATKHTKNAFWTSLAACSINLIMNVYLIPRHGIQGAAIATFFSYFICFWIRLADARKYIPFYVFKLRTWLNTSVIIIMSCIMITQPKGYMIWLSVMALFVVIENLESIMLTVKKLLKR